MDNLGKGCASEDCTQILKIQAGKDAIACTKAQQAKEDVGNDKCEAFFYAWTSSLTFRLGLTEIPGSVLAD